MSYAPINGTGTGVAPVVNLTWPFNQQADVYATVNGAAVTFTWSGPAQITFSAAVASNVPWEVYRKTSITNPATTFTDNAVLTAAELSAAQNQQLYREQELAFDVGRAVLIPNGDTIGALPAAAARANMVFGFDANGNPAMLFSSPPTLAQAFQIYRFVYTGGAQTFLLPVTPTGVQEVFRNGIVVDEGDWSLSGSTITISNNVTLSNGDVIRVRSGQTAIVPTIDVSNITISPSSPSYANDAAAAAGGVPIGKLYRNGSVIQARIT